MGAGRLRDRAAFQRELLEEDIFGNETRGNWGPLVTVWAQFTPERSWERIEGGRLEAAVAGTLRLRSTPQTRDVTEADRVVVDEVLYNIRGITNPDRRNRWLEITVERGVEA